MIAVLIGVELAQVDQALRYERAAVAAGEWWRLFSGHLVHLSFGHTVLNAAGFVLVMLLAGHCLRAFEWVAAALVTAAATGLGLWLLMPELAWYVGLSGLLHGLIGTGALTMLVDAGKEPGSERRRQRVRAAAIIAVLILKLGWEQLYGPLPGTVESSEGPVVVEAHLFGALAGAAWAMLRISRAPLAS